MVIQNANHEVGSVIENDLRGHTFRSDQGSTAAQRLAKLGSTLDRSSASAMQSYSQSSSMFPKRSARKQKKASSKSLSNVCNLTFEVYQEYIEVLEFCHGNRKKSLLRYRKTPMEFECLHWVYNTHSIQCDSFLNLHQDILHHLQEGLEGIWAC